jgi:hypothetical protein
MESTNDKAAITCRTHGLETKVHERLESDFFVYQSFDRRKE